ncbi:sensor histidine kinase [Paractinoplanes durhamensis]|uniref:histidine kinase n=1 Tax=Paractinoplanes durhamensis TaxID=113563 RepID=A0ABQ3ZCZ2_9ACTN|nr:nitrate- and nitrite sensing domain-containing protein [Actinoplanes durhamensis]GIE07689.1 histidine kinase [Actinoplanes durhamensis]
MLLSKLRIRGKLTLLVMIPLLAMAGLVLPVIRNLVTDANRANDVNADAVVAGQVGPLLQDLQRERLLSVGYLLGAVDADALQLQIAAVTDRVRDIRLDLGDELPSAVRTEIDKVADLNKVRQGVRSRTITPDQVLEQFAPVLDDMIESLQLTQHADAGSTAGRQLITLDAVLGLNESSTESTALLAVMAAGGDIDGMAERYREETVEYEVYLDRFEAFATQSERELYDLVASAFQERVGQNFNARLEADPAKTMAALPLDTLFPTLQSFSVLGGFVEKRLVSDTTALVDQQRREQLTIAYGIGALALVVLLAVLILVAIVARAVAVPLTRLSRSAEQVAEAGEAELRRVADDESEPDEPVRLDVLDVNTNDEIGELARAFERVRNTASQLVERQVLSRHNVAEMFGHIGRRTQNLVGGQVSLIDELENDETSSDRLAKLYQLDHIANRLRRSADSLVVISGATREQNHSAPVRLVDVVRLALAEIEEYNRVDIDVPLDLLLAPAVVSDMVLVCAELLENATTFSPPHTRVAVIGRAVPGGAQLVVVDHGIGMPDERLAEEHARIGRRERLDLVPTQVLGLFVVGRLARRHGLDVALQHTPGGGVTVSVQIGGGLLAGERVATSAEPVELVAVPEQRQISVEWSQPPWDTAGPTAPAASASYRPAPEPAPRLPSQRRPDTISRVAEAMGDPLTWNGFQVVRSLPTAPPHRDTPTVTFREPPAAPRPQSLVQAPIPDTAHPPVPGLNRRIPGARLPAGTSAEVPSREPVLADAAAALEVVEAFEDGVRRALNVVAPAPPGEIRALSRRVPGATLPASPSSPRRSIVDVAAVEQDPDEARSLVEQFESGVARALEFDDFSQRN